MPTKYQTIEGFLINPFNKKPYPDKVRSMDLIYKNMKVSNRIQLHAMTIIESSYYYHIKVPSESAKADNYQYDVVIRFFTDDPKIKNENNLINYYVQFFSNSPSFIYQYAYLYNKEGYLIADVYSKTDVDFIRVSPEKSNKKMELCWDKSLYLAARYLSDNKLRLLAKRGPVLLKRKTKNNFFRGIADFNAVKFDRELMNEEKRLAKSLKNDTSLQTAINNTARNIKQKKGSMIEKSNKRSINIKDKIKPSGRVSKRSKIRAKSSTSR